jgi:hypothetical protein
MTGYSQLTDGPDEIRRNDMASVIAEARRIAAEVRAAVDEVQLPPDLALLARLAADLDAFADKYEPHQPSPRWLHTPES